MIDAFRWTALAALIVFVVAFAGAVVVSSQQSAIPSYQQQSEENAHKDESKKHPKTLWNSWFPEPLSLYTLVLTIFTAVLAAAGLIQLNLLGRAEQIAAESAQAAHKTADAALKQTKAMERQLALMEVDQRPWLKAQFEILKPLVFDDKGLQLELSGKTSNVGKLPAFNAALYPLILPLTAGIDLAKRQREHCENVIKNVRKDRPDGAIIFPGDHIINSPITTGFSPEVVESAKRMPGLRPPNEVAQDFFGLVLTGCVVYAFPGQRDSKPRMTGFGYQLHTAKSFGIDTKKGTIPVNEMEWFVVPELTWAD